MKPEELEKWNGVRAKGKARFILVQGVAAWGLPMFVVMTFIINKDQKTVAHLLVSLVVWAIGGALFGVTMWTINEKRRAKEISKTNR